MNCQTGREFNFTNPQDDPQLYPKLPEGFHYDLYGNVKAIPVFQPKLQEKKPNHMQIKPKKIEK